MFALVRVLDARAYAMLHARVAQTTMSLCEQLTARGLDGDNDRLNVVVSFLTAHGFEDVADFEGVPLVACPFFVLLARLQSCRYRVVGGPAWR